ncbi:MAG: hypothetical protein HKN21_00850, partial [Candidatus Eisenbacteria bacterium]|nr:hypothetical protein [Candidatus Eisenbacteria bacterium]
LYTRSLTQEALSLLTNDRTRDYRAPRFERVLIPYFRAWNYIEQGDVEGALVEARKINERLEFERTQCPDEDGACGEDAFLRFFSGLVFEWGGEWNDAYVAYKLSREAGVGKIPFLGPRLLAMSDRLGFRDEHRRWRETYGSPSENTGLVVAFVELGVVGHRYEVSLNVPIFKEESHLIVTDIDRWSHTLSHRVYVDVDDSKLDYFLRIAMPEFLAPHPDASRVAVALECGEKEQTARLAKDVVGEAYQHFQEASGSVLVRSIARALTKYFAKEAADDKIGKGAGFLVNILGAATETADLRSWRSLPGGIQIAALELPPGTYETTLKINGHETVGSVTADFGPVEVGAEQIAFLRFRSTP